MPWALVNSWTFSSAVAQVDFTGLAGKTDVRILLNDITLSGSGFRTLRVSTDNGSTFLNTTADYFSVDGAGVETAVTNIGFHVTATAVARSGDTEICGFNLTSPKVAQRQNRTDARTSVIPTTSALNAIRIFDSNGFNLTGGSIYVYAR